MQERTLRRGVTARARWLDRIGRHLIAIGGIGIIAAVMGIFVFILAEAYPLFREPVLQEAGALEGRGQALGVDPYREIAFLVNEEGVDFLDLESGQILRRERPEEVAGRRIVSAHSSPGNGWLGLGLDDGGLLVCRVEFELEYATGEREVKPVFRVEEEMVLDRRGEALVGVAFQDDGEGRAAAVAITQADRVLIALRQQQQGLLGPGERVLEVHEVGGLRGRPTTALVDGRVRQALVGTDQGEVFEWRLGEVDEEPVFAGAFAAAPPGTGIATLAYVLGELSLVVGDGQGQVSTWFKVQEGEERRYRQIHSFQPHPAPVVHMAFSLRDKQFLTADATGVVALHHNTSARTFFQVETGSAPQGLAFAPKADGFVVLARDGRLLHYALDQPHPEISGTVLLGKVWYEGYQGPEYVWQSTGGTDEFEPKLSLVPLIFGTAKGTLYAMLFALPLSVLAALYTAEFAHPRVRNLVKPTVEVMASLPSVILGFLAGLWLAPLLETRLAGALLLFPMVPVVVLAAAWGWSWLPSDLTRRLAHRGEVYVLVAVSFLALWLAFVLGPAFEKLAFEGALLGWLRQEGGVAYDQRNCLVVGFAMGFAVIPLIFTICEDALSSVPRHLRAGSLALGATPWQTAVRVVLPMALPGVFSAAMIGFGRAIGETMIVLMATGNTPIMDWSIFNGMRTISANIAVELPEAPHEGTLYRVLFLSGLLLFGATFCVNTLAEVVRQRLREKYSRL